MSPPLLISKISNILVQSPIKKKQKPHILNVICKLGIVPVRIHPKDSAEMVTQLLYGEQCYMVKNTNVLLPSTPGWEAIKTIFDDYSGFVDRLQIQAVESAEASVYIVKSPLVKINDQFLPMGSELTATELSEHQTHELSTAGVISKINAISDREAIIKCALKFLGSPYLWGGKSVLGVDCSGLTQVVCKTTGYHLPRDSGQQAKKGVEVKLENACNGDLAFFSKPGKGNVSHVGFVLKEDESLKIIHASGHVRIDQLTHDGIVRQDGRITHRLLHLKDIVSSTR